MGAASILLPREAAKARYNGGLQCCPTLDAMGLTDRPPQFPFVQVFTATSCLG